MNRFFYVVCLLGLMSIVISCHENTVNEDVRALMSSKLWIPEKISGCKNDYVILRYIKPKSCTSCELDMGRWRVYRRQLENRFKDKVDVFFIVETSNTAEAKRIAAIYNFSHNIIIDSIGAFMNENKTIKPFGNDIVMLMDSTLSVVAVGDPCKGNKIRNLYDSLMIMHSINDLPQRRY